MYYSDIANVCLFQKEKLIEEVVNGLRHQYINPAKSTNYLSFIVNLTR